MSGQLSDKVDDLVSSIDELEEVLGPLLDIPLSKLTTELSGPLDRAKLQVWLSYILNDLVWIYLKTRGTNPSNLESGEPHDVVAELDRVKSYFSKIREAEDPAKRTLTVDGKVANRFIKHALASAISPANFASSSSSGAKPTHTRFDQDDNSTLPTTSQAKPVPESSEKSSSSSDSEGEPEVGTWKAKKRAREADLANQRTGEGQESDDDVSMDGWEETSAKSTRAVEVNDASVEASGRTKRPRIDPFAGYSQPSSKPDKPASTRTKPSTPSSSTTAPRPAAIIQQPNDAARQSPALSSTSSNSQATSSKKRTRRGTRGPGSKYHSSTSSAPEASRKKSGLAKETSEK